MAAPEAYCVKCKTKREMKDATQITMKNGRPATEGKCPKCGTKMFKIGAAYRPGRFARPEVVSYTGGAPKIWGSPRRSRLT